MLRDEILAKLRADKAVLDDFGVKSIGLFGSVARGDDDDMSDIDIVVDFHDGRVPSLVGLVRLQDHLEDLLGRPIDIASPNSPNPRLNRTVEREAVYA